MQQLGMGGDAGAAAHQLDAGALINIAVPADPAQERRGEQARHRAADDDGPPFGWSRHGAQSLEHDPEKWEPVFGQDHAQIRNYIGAVDDQRSTGSSTGRLSNAASAMIR